MAPVPWYDYVEIDLSLRLNTLSTAKGQMQGEIPVTTKSKGKSGSQFWTQYNKCVRKYNEVEIVKSNVDTLSLSLSLSLSLLSLIHI